MPNFPWGSHPEEAGIRDAALTSLLAGSALPPEAGAGLQSLADLLSALTAGAAGDELAGEDAALAAFRERDGVPGSGHQPSRPARHRAGGAGWRHRRAPAAVPFPGAAAAAAVAMVAALGLGGAVAAAFAGVLPAPIQQLAHDVIGAPAHQANPSPAGPPGGPAAPGGTPHATGRAHVSRPSPDASHPSPHPTPSHPSPHPTPSHPSPHPSPSHPSPHPTPSHPSPHASPSHPSPHATALHLSAPATT